MPQFLCYFQKQEPDLFSALTIGPQTELFRVQTDIYIFSHIYSHTFIISVIVVYFILRKQVMRITKLKEIFSIFRSQFESKIHFRAPDSL